MYAYPRHHHPCLSPISNLPVELLSYIFSLSTHATTDDVPSPDDHTEEEEEHGPPTITTESVQIPLVLSTVSRLWRQVALGTPHLWHSLCITAELVQDFYCIERDSNGFKKRSISSQLNTSHITSYLALSRRHPLNILIDARDENWNFEPESVFNLQYFISANNNKNKNFHRFISDDHGVELYTPVFTSEHMNTVFALLLPHLSRWKSLSILTDCWAPMYTALNAINPFITRFGAPLLESLSLMRCNDLISFSPQFQPQQLREPAFLKRDTNDTTTHSDLLERCPNLLPSLQYLSLRGVHVDWDTLGDSLSTSETGLTWLELAWHSQDVRPSPDQFHKLLSSSSGLRNFILSGSGPRIPEDDAVSIVHHDHVPAHLPHLRNITVGYRSALEGRIALELLDAPNAKELTLEDVTYAGDPEVVNAGTLLSYIGTRQLGEAHQNHRVTAYELPETLGYPSDLVADKALSMSCTHVNNVAESRAAFPLLENVTLRGVKTCSQPLRVFFGALSNLQHLELTRMSMQAIHVLLPSDQTTTTTTTTTTHDDDCYTNSSPLSLSATPFFMSPNMKVNIISDTSSDEDDYYVDGQVDDVDVDPYEPGGAFNDPFFDAYYSSHFQITR